MQINIINTMSKLPFILPRNSDGFNQKGKPQTPISTTSETYNSNQTDILPIGQLNQNNQIKYNPLINEAKFADFESKMILLEEANSILLNRLLETEKNFDLKLKQVEQKNDLERVSRSTTDRTVNEINEKNNYDSTDLRKKIILIQNYLEKEEKRKIDQKAIEADIYKRQLDKITKQITSTVKMEVDARYKADIVNQDNLQVVAARLDNEIELIKREMEVFLSSTKAELQQTSKDCSERTHNVSKYIDRQLCGANIGQTNTLDNLKSFVSKLTEQVKTNFLAQSTHNDSFDSRVTAIEESLPLFREILYQYVGTVEERILQKMKDFKLYADLNIKKVHEEVNNSIRDLSNNINKNNQILSQHVIDTRSRVNVRFEEIERENKLRFKTICEDFTTITNRLYLLEDILKQNGDDNQAYQKKINEDVSSVKIYIDLQAINEKIIREIETSVLRQNIKDCIDALTNIGANFETNMSEINNNSNSNYNGLVDRINFLQDALNQIAEKEFEMFNGVKNRSDVIEVNQIISEIMFKVENNNIIEQLQQNKQFEIDMKNEISCLYSTLDNSGNNMNELLNDLTNIRNANKENERIIAVNKTIEQILNTVDLRARELHTTSNNTNQAGHDMIKLVNALERKLNDYVSSNEIELIAIKELIAQVGDRNRLHGDTSITDINNTLYQIITNAEFENVYKELNKNHIIPSNQGIEKKIEANNDITKKVLGDYSDIIDSKIAKAMEKVKEDNINMWTNAVELAQKYNESSGMLLINYIIYE